MLRKHNEPKRAATSEDAPPASLWHAMQQRQRPSSSSSEEAEQGSSAGHNNNAWLENGTGDLFDTGYGPGRAAGWHVAQPTAETLHATAEEQRRQATVLDAQVDEGDTMVGDVAAAGLAASSAAGKSRKGPGIMSEGSETSSSMMGNLMNTMRR